MENLSLDDRQAQPTPPSQMAPQLPPQMFTTAAQLLDLTDKKLVVVLRDGRKLIGVLRSWDQYANLVLQDTIERLFVNNLYADIKHGLYIVRGENVLLLGEIDLDLEDNIPEPFKEADPNVVRSLLKIENDNKKKQEKSRGQMLHKHGFERDFGGDAII